LSFCCSGGPGVQTRGVVGPIVAPAGGFGATVVDPGDADVDDTHRFEVVKPPEHGHVELTEAGTVIYGAPYWFEGDDRVVVRVTDDGEPPLSAEFEIPITVGSDGRLDVRPRGCSTAPFGAPGALLVGVVLLVRRRGYLPGACRPVRTTTTTTTTTTTPRPRAGGPARGGPAATADGAG
jgi:uncharacterized protein (TIGR03382 family)